MPDLTRLSAAIPNIAKALGDMMVSDGIPALSDNGLSLEDGNPIVSITFRGKDGVPDVKVSLEITLDVDEDA